MSALEDRAEILLIDTGAGIHRGVLAFALAADTSILLTTPEPTSIRDAYGVLKTLKASTEGGNKKDVAFVVNMANNENEGLEVANRLRMAASQFLDFSIHYLGCIVKDHSVERAVRARKPFYQLYPHSAATRCVKNLVRAMFEMPGERVADFQQPKGVKAFFFRLTRGYFVER
jgi:flagellar biosynthesis protein FlhG